MKGELLPDADRGLDDDTQRALRAQHQLLEVRPGGRARYAQRLSSPSGRDELGAHEQGIDPAIPVDCWPEERAAIQPRGVECSKDCGKCPRV